MTARNRLDRGTEGASATRVGPIALGLSLLPETGFETHIVHDLAALESLAQEWDALFSRCPDSSPCALHAWLVEWWRAFGEGPYGRERNAALFVVLVRTTEGDLVSAFPMFEECAVRPSIQARRLREVGSLGRVGVYEMTEEPTALVPPGYGERALRALADALRPHLSQGRWDQASLHFGSGISSETVRSAMSGLGAKVRLNVREDTGSCMAALPATWSEYRRKLSKSMRDNLGYYPRLLTRHALDWELRVRKVPEEMQEATERLCALHRARSQQLRGRSHTDHLHSPSHRAFFAALLLRLSKTGQASVGELVVDGEVVASQAFFETEGTLTAYYSGYLERMYAYSPIFVVDAAMFEEAQARGVRRLSFLRSRTDWVRRWGALPGPQTVRAGLVLNAPGSRIRLALHRVRTAWALGVLASGCALHKVDRFLRNRGR